MTVGPEVTRRVFVTGTAVTLMGSARASAPPDRSPPTSRKAEGLLRVAMIGMQGHVGYVLDGIQQVSDCRLEAVARSMPGEPIERLKGSPAWTERTRVYDDYRRMLDEVQPGLVGVFMPYARNAEANIEAVRRGCHVISEKPLATEMDELIRLREARDKAGVRITALLPLRLQPEFLAARQVVKDGVIGEPVLITAQKSYRWGTDRPDFYKQRKTYGGTIPWVAIHAIDFMRYVSGLEYTEVTGRQAVKVHKDYPECEDCGALLFGMSNGGHAALTFDFLRPQKAPSHGDDRLRVVGSKGVLEIRGTAKTFTEVMTDRAAPQALPQVEKRKEFFADFVDELRGEGTHILSPEDPFRATEVAIKAREAADTRKTVSL